jgi:hypothetical protein
MPKTEKMTKKSRMSCPIGSTDERIVLTIVLSIGTRLIDRNGRRARRIRSTRSNLAEKGIESNSNKNKLKIED